MYFLSIYLSKFLSHSLILMYVGVYVCVCACVHTFIIICLNLCIVGVVKISKRISKIMINFSRSFVYDVFQRMSFLVSCDSLRHGKKLVSCFRIYAYMYLQKGVILKFFDIQIPKYNRKNSKSNYIFIT